MNSLQARREPDGAEAHRRGDAQFARGLFLRSPSAASGRPSSLVNTSCAVRYSTSPCSVRIRPRAWRWNSGTFRSSSSALICRLTADCDRPSSCPAWVKLPASATAWKMLSLSQSMTLFSRMPLLGFACAASARLQVPPCSPCRPPSRPGDRHHRSRRPPRRRRQWRSAVERGSVIEVAALLEGQLARRTIRSPACGRWR